MPDNTPAPNITAGIVRHTAGALGAGTFAASHDELYQLVGAIVTVLSLAWSIWEKTRSQRPPPAGPAAGATLGLLLAGLLLGGCATPATPQQTVGKSLATIAQTVDAGMKGWAKWVDLRLHTPGASPAELLMNEGRVKVAYERYQSAMAAARKSYAAWTTSGPRPADLDTTVAALSAAQADLLSLIDLLSHPAK